MYILNGECAVLSLIFISCDCIRLLFSGAVAFPGTMWLARMALSEAASSTIIPNITNDDISIVTSPTNDDNEEKITSSSHFVYDGQQYATVYEAIVFHHHSSPNPCRNFNAYINSIFISNAMATTIVRASFNSLEVGHYVLCYIRNFIGAMVIYYGIALFFHYFCYHYYGTSVFEEQNRIRPSSTIMYNQIKLAQSSMFLYVCLPVLGEYIIEQNYTLVYYTIHEIGGIYWYLFYTVLYFSIVEIGIYWMHRTLHTNKWMYKNIHMLHHQYNKPETLTPWASIAFHPLDGILQASPYVATLLLVPCHYITHTIMLFFTAIWATYIHDAMDFNILPIIMGSKYHTVHHTHYIYNYGQIFVFCDQIWGTYQAPTAPTGTSTNSTAGGKRMKARTTATNSTTNMLKSKVQ